MLCNSLSDGEITDTVHLFQRLIQKTTLKETNYRFCLAVCSVVFPIKDAEKDPPVPADSSSFL